MIKDRRTTVLIFCATWVAMTAATLHLNAQESQDQKIFRIGIIGTTTSHVPAAIHLINDNPDDNELFRGFKITAAYPGGMPDNPDSWGRVEKYADECRAKEIEIFSTIEAMLPHVDGVMLESVDGRPHLEQAKPVLAAKKLLFIDKPMAGSLADVLEIFRLAQEANLEIFSASSLRYASKTQEFRNTQPLGKILGVEASGPCTLQPKHPDLFWYGVHGVETLFTLMGSGCESVSRTQTVNSELAVGVWDDERIGTFRGSRKTYSFYATVFCEKGIGVCENYDGYKPLFIEVCKYFQTGKAPIDPNETTEMFAFMVGADVSKKLHGATVKLSEVIENARHEKQLTVELVLSADGGIYWNGEGVSLDTLAEKVEKNAADGTVVRILLNNRAGANFATVQKVLEQIDAAYLANYLY